MEEIKERKVETLNIYEKMSCIISELKTLEKTLEVKINQSKSYKAVNEKTVLEAVKPLEEKYRVFSYPKQRSIIDNDILVKENSNGDYISKTNTLFMRIETIYTFVNLDDPKDTLEIITYGDGLDTGDKAPGKAMTYADKYALMKAYKITTGDDPDKEPSPENGYTKGTKATPEQIKILLSFYKDENLAKLLSANKINKI